MPTNGNARAMSALSGFGLFLTGIVLCYVNSTTATGSLSTIYLAAMVVISIAMCTKWAAAFGVEHGIAKAFDYVASLVPWIAAVFCLIQALHYTNEGASGAFAFLAVMALTVNIAFGMFDSITTLIGSKYKQASDAMHEGLDRISAASDALSQGRRN